MKKLIIALCILLATQLNAEMPTKTSVTKLYIATFDRTPDMEGLEYWVYSSGLTLEGIATSFFDQPETQEKYNYKNQISDLDNFIETVYKNLFARDPDKKGLSYWKAQLRSGGVNYSEFILAVMNGALGDDAELLEMKTNSALITLDLGDADQVFIKIYGNVVDSKGNPISESLIALIFRDSKGKDKKYQIRSDANGYYELKMDKNDFSIYGESETLMLMAVKDDYELGAFPIKLNEKNQWNLNIPIKKLTPYEISIISEPLIIHLGDDSYNGSINSNFQSSAIGLSWEHSFTETHTQSECSEADVAFQAKGVQWTKMIFNSTSYEVPESANDGSYSSYKIRVDATGSVYDTVQFVSESPYYGDYDDLEFTNVKVTFCPDQNGATDDSSSDNGQSGGTSIDSSYMGIWYEDEEGEIAIGYIYPDGVDVYFGDTYDYSCYYAYSLDVEEFNELLKTSIDVNDYIHASGSVEGIIKDSCGSY